ncbi:hypothetical protein QYZ14_21595, partial [Xanthomonas campestris pv. campestris]|nr:hypothetical protein [Xanthomonas campestris pv. campestris]
HLERHGLEARVDHRSLRDQGIERTAEPHFGPGRVKRMTAAQDVELAAVLERRAAEGEKERAAAELGKSIIDLSGDLGAAKAERDRKQAMPPPDQLRAGMEAARAQFEAHKLAEAGKQQAREAFERFKAEQRAAELAREQAAQKAAQELARQRQEVERKQEAEKKTGLDRDTGYSR